MVDINRLSHRLNGLPVSRTDETISDETWHIVAVAKTNESIQRLFLRRSR